MSRLLKRGLVFCIKSIDLVKVLIYGGEGFIKVRVGIIYGVWINIATPNVIDSDPCRIISFNWKASNKWYI